jgi:hypothetical protein
MKSFASRAKWAVLALPLASPSCNSGSGGGNNPSPSSSLTDWMPIDVAQWLPSGALDALHQLPVVTWLV